MNRIPSRDFLKASGAALLLALISAGIHFFSGVSTEKKVVAEVRLKAEESGVAQLFWDQGNGYSESDSSRGKIVGKDGFQTVRLDLPIGEVSSFRFDPTNQASPVVLKSIQFMAPLGTPLEVLPLSGFQPNASTTTTESIDLGVKVASVNPSGAVDPQLLFAPPEPIEIDYSQSVFVAGALKVLAGVWILLMVVYLTIRLLFGKTLIRFTMDLAIGLKDNFYLINRPEPKGSENR